MIIRRRHTANYTTIGNVLFEDERLSADEVGILAYLLSRPNDWEVRRPALMRRWRVGVVATKRIVHNWMRTGWCHAEKVRLPNGTFYVVYEIRDQPGEELTDEQIREALSLVSSEGSHDEFRSENADDQPHETDQPPPCDRGVADQGVATDRWPIKDITNNGLPRDDSYQKAEREHARAKEKHALNLAEFKRRWPTNAGDDQVKVDNAWFALTVDEGEAALAGITPFLENQKRLKKTLHPAGFNYLGQKRWTLLEAQRAEGGVPPALFARDSAEARALVTLHELVGVGEGYRKIYVRADGVSYKKPMTPQLLAFANIPAPADWVTLTHQQAGAWEGLLREAVNIQVRKHLKEGDRAPWPWPPSAEGKIYATGPPEALMSEQDLADFK